ncbi:putative RNA-directed DNA polymerase from transposon BS [Trichonephila clavipes]|uniref:Putative RNA-directed DNA polymerase from transposon BS n=1 Tax=Trichonephila clavipes TaxID=2585209 RepID=A0A8X7BKN7_TRICX|nr:putative RNA-directed DNA polymerase from transposon BS [Trichonephila clavipes]
MSERLNYSKYPTYLGFTLDSKVNCGKHIEKIADKARKTLKILKYLSGRDWGSVASTLGITHTTLVHPVHEYGYQIFQVASPTNLKKLERVQLSAARIITGLRYCCPTDILLYEADIQLLTMRFEVYSYSYITPIDYFDHVEFREELLTSSTPKHRIHPELLRQLALEVINYIPYQALIIYTNGNRPGYGSELIAISGALDHALNSYNDSTWILTDSRSSIQYLKNLPKITDSTALDILSKLGSVRGNKFPIHPEFQLEQASPQHIVDCLETGLGRYP